MFTQTHYYDASWEWWYGELQGFIVSSLQCFLSDVTLSKDLIFLISKFDQSLISAAVVISTWHLCTETSNACVGLVEVYKCELLASTCGQCLTLGTEYTCVWCEDQCRNEASCQAPGEILTRDDVCPDPQILSVSVVFSSFWTSYDDVIC